MKKYICLLAALCCLLMLMGCKKTPGEETLPPDTQPTQTTTAPTETTTPPETTVPEETTAALMTEDIPYLLIQDQINEVDPETEGTVIHTPDLDASGLVSATHIRFFTELSSVGTYKDGVFRVCTDEWEGNSGSHYQGYVIEEGQIKALANKTLSGTLSVEGREIPVDMQYVIYRDKVIVTYIPNSSFITILDDSRGASDCLVRLEYWDRETNSDYFTCVAYMDMKTGTLKSSFSKFENKGFSFIGLNNEGNVIIQRGEDKKYWLINLSNGSCVKNYSYETQEYALTYEHLYVDGKSYLEVTDPMDGETVLLKTPEYWNFKEVGWRSSADGRKLMDTRGDHDILIYDGDRNMWIEISRELPNGQKEDICFWTENNEIVLVSKNRRYACIYSLAGE